MSQHNTHDLTELSENNWECVSHNFPECAGKGASEYEAWDDMNRKLIYLSDNEPNRAKANILFRLQNRLLCMCGHPLEEPPIAVYKGGNLGTIVNANS